MRRLRILTIILVGFLGVLWCHAASAEIVTFGSGTNQFSMTFVSIGNANNADDTAGDPNPAGSVAYEYQMGKFEVSEDMITKFNASQSLQITKDTRGPNKPATSVSWNEAAHFVNWLNTSKGYQAAYNFRTGGVNDNIALWNPADAWQLGGENLFRHKDAHYWLPSMDEWYKAAYYNPATSSYFDYPTFDGNVPIAVSSGTGAGTAVYDQSTSTGPADITDAGGLSPYGIMALGGNVYEWEETEYDLVNDSPSSGRGVRSGGWNSTSFILSSSFRGGVGNTFDAAFENDGLGFRVASLSSDAGVVPEPSSLVVWTLTGLCGLWWGRRLRK